MVLASKVVKIDVKSKSVMHATFECFSVYLLFDFKINMYLGDCESCHYELLCAEDSPTLRGIRKEICMLRVLQCCLTIKS